MSRLLLTGVLAALGAALATTAVAALARAGGVDLEVSGEPIPLSGVAVVTGVLSLAGLALAAALRRWCTRPAARFVATTVALTAVSLVPPLLADADAATVGTLVGLHLVAAVVVIPVLARGLGSASGSGSGKTDGPARFRPACPGAGASVFHQGQRWRVSFSQDRSDPTPARCPHSENPARSRARSPTVRGVAQNYYFRHLPGAPVQAVVT